AILTRIETTARAEAIPCLRLETGVGLDAAIALYEATGFVARPAFGAYSDSPASLFYEKNLTALGG
ncbi:MAG: GNAT family N-acetyltransferase, partial [Paracoccaceae bacterium]